VPLSNEDVVYQTLRNEQGSMFAYAILTALKGTNIKAAIQVYRALDRLIAQRKVHRIASLNAFVACSREAHDTPPGFFICSSCGVTTELAPRPGLGAISGAAAGALSPRRYP
jgi:Fur family zinc uptake transcriptional regulator